MEDAAHIEKQWRVCPAKMQPKKAMCTWVVIIIIGAAVVSTDPIVGSVLMLLFIGSLSAFLFPTTYTIDEEGVRAHFPIRKKYYAWEQVRRVKFFNDACYLFTRKKPSILDGWSGVALFYGEGKSEIVSAIKSHLREDVAT